MTLRAQAIIYDVFACPFSVYLEQYIDIINVKKVLTRFVQELNHVIKCSYGILTYLLVSMKLSLGEMYSFFWIHTFITVKRSVFDNI